MGGRGGGNGMVGFILCGFVMVGKSYMIDDA